MQFANMPHDGDNIGLLPSGVSIHSLGLDSDSDLELSQPNSIATEPNVLVSFVGDKETTEELPFTSQYFDAKHYGFRLGSQESINNDSEDTDLDLSQKSQQSEKNFTIPSTDTSAIKAQINDLPIADGIIIPRSNTPTEAIIENSDEIPDLESKLNPVTPTKPESSEGIQDPWTPTANLKMLISAASPEIRNREKLKQLQCTEDSLDSDVSSLLSISAEVETVTQAPSKTRKKQPRKQKNKQLEDIESMEFDGELGFEVTNAPESQTTSSRKEKSLGLLCQRFLQKFPEYPEDPKGLEICLDAVAKDLNVERRRIYDIINVLESVEIVSRLAKNKYSWHGKRNLSHTLSKLRALAWSDGFAAHIKEFELIRTDAVDSDGNPSSPRKRLPLRFSDELNHQFGLGMITNTSSGKEAVRKDRSLGIMSQKFLMLFLVSQPRTVNLDIAAKILIGDPNVDKTETGKFKTKIRRLYDIANILTSLNLIRKIHVTEVRGRKPAFKYVGPAIDALDDMTECSQDKSHRPHSRHSLLDCVQNPQVQKLMNGDSSISGKSLLCRSLSFNSDRVMPSAPSKKSFARHSSFDMICDVAAQERDRLYFESRAQTASPSSKASTILPKTSTPRINISGSLKNYKVVPASESIANRAVPIRISTVSVNSTTPSFVAPNLGRTNMDLPVRQEPHVQGNVLHTSTGHVAAAERGMSRTTPVTQDKKPTVITISRQQLDALMKKPQALGQPQANVLKVIQGGKAGGTHVIQINGVSTQARGVKRAAPEGHHGPMDKRPCVEDRQDAEVEEITEKSVSPQRSLTFQDHPVKLLVPNPVKQICQELTVSSPGSTLSTPTLHCSQDLTPGDALTGPVEYPSLDTTHLVPSPATTTPVSLAQLRAHTSVTSTLLGATPASTGFTPNSGTAQASWTPTPTGITRGARGIPPSAGKIVNLLPFFGSPGSEIKVMTPGVRQIKIIPQRMTQMATPGSSHMTVLPCAAVKKPVPIASVDSSLSPQMLLTPESRAVAIDATVTPQSQTLNSSFLTPTLRTPAEGHVVLTPGTFFRTPQVTAAQISAVINSNASAFQMVGQTAQLGETSTITGRRLALSD